jgi:hypothetical protein
MYGMAFQARPQRSDMPRIMFQTPAPAERTAFLFDRGCEQLPALGTAIVGSLMDKHRVMTATFLTGMRFCGSSHDSASPFFPNTLSPENRQAHFSN